MLLRKIIFSAVLLAGIAAELAALDITRAHVIVKEKLSGLPSEHSVVILANHLEKMLGKRPAVFEKAKYDGKKPAIFMIQDPTYGPEEYSITPKGKNLEIRGGFPRGVHYGCTDFLERFGKVRYLTVKNWYIPKCSKIVVPDGTKIRRSPAFPLQRSIHPAVPGKRTNILGSMLRSNSNPAVSVWPSLYHNRGIGNGHTYYKLTKALGKDQEHMLPVNERGKRMRATVPLGPGQICFYNPEFREFTKKQVALWIKETQAYVKKHKLNEKLWTLWIDLSANDNTFYCQCKGCHGLIKKYGNIAGAQLEFINDIAAAYPDYLIQTFSYHRTMIPPKNIKARDNVMIHFAYLGLGGGKEYFDTIRPLSHPLNAKLMEFYKGWKDIVKHKAIWEYHRMFPMTEAFSWPQCCFWYIGENFRFYHEYGAKKMFIQSEISGFTRAFHDLHVYLEYKLMDDPYLDDKKLINEFFEYQYGKAAPEMHAYANFLRKQLESFPKKFANTPLQARPFLNKNFFSTIEKLLGAALKKVKGDPEKVENIVIEYLPVDFAHVNLLQQLGGTDETRRKLCDRIAKNLRIAYDRYFFNSGRDTRVIRKNLELELLKVKGLRNPLPIPPGMEKEDIVQIPVVINERSSNLVDDPEATFGKAIKVAVIKDKRFDHGNQPMEFGIYNVTARRYELKRIVKPEDVKQDEKYHLYKVGRTLPKGFEKQVFWFHRSWHGSASKTYQALWKAIDPNRVYDLYVSCKMTGPAYVKGSKKPNAVYVDKIVAIKR